MCIGQEMSGLLTSGCAGLETLRRTYTGDTATQVSRPLLPSPSLSLARARALPYLTLTEATSARRVC